jgi:hypothetical protein
VVGGLRGVFFFNFGAAGYEGVPMNVWTSSDTVATPIIDYVADPTSPSGARPVFGPPVAITGFRLVDSRASYGVGIETFALGFPIHFDWSWRTLFNRGWEDVVYALNGGSDWFRRVRFDVWIGYDF